jgi:hypothetical protein
MKDILKKALSDLLIGASWAITGVVIVFVVAFFIYDMPLNVFSNIAYVEEKPYQYSKAKLDAERREIQIQVEQEFAERQTKEWNDLQPVMVAKCKKSVTYYGYKTSEGFMMNCDGADFTYQAKSEYPSAWRDKKGIFVISKDTTFKNKLISMWKKSPNYKKHLEDEALMKKVTKIMNSSCMQNRMRQASVHQALKKAMPELYPTETDTTNMSVKK